MDDSRRWGGAPGLRRRPIRFRRTGTGKVQSAAAWQAGGEAAHGLAFQALLLKPDRWSLPNMYDALEDKAPLSLMDFVAAARARIQELTPEQLEQMRGARPDLLLLDVRESSEHEQGHIGNALLVPRGILEAAADPAYSKHVAALADARDQPVILYCATGGRSAMAALTLQLMGYREVYSLAGGIVQWEKEGRPIVREARYI